MSNLPKIICVTGGKGGTGKTLVAVNLAIMFKNDDFKVLLLDGDTENPNTYLLLGGKLESRSKVPFFAPKIVDDRCNRCGLCTQNCISHALLHVDDSIPIPITNVCSGCKLCYKICPENAIESDYRTIGWIYELKLYDISLLVGDLKTGEARSGAIVNTLIDRLDTIISTDEDEIDIVIIDTAPGAHCDVESLIERADYILPVTEPTKFGKLDLNRIIELINLLNKEYRVILNRSSLLGFREEFLRQLNQSNIPIMGDIPMDNDIVKSYCQGYPFMENHQVSKENNNAYNSFKDIYENLNNWIKQ